ncbi:hypothetical protein K435DRAFT_801385 [Dendrothele bispora CBS 962.96]|uniref:Uncharacterized protein n=1 Tax=Dendrothele bispora (strain CBS 962.96) TaxID=1314807 RepID=A0A4S8LPH8_DENBC|nr:hypothetical protein K435DRAFT_801385 [Dendrothele bispora CBS 962.96]
MGKLADAMRYVGPRKRKLKRNTAATNAARRGTPLHPSTTNTSRERLLAKNDDDGDSDAYSDGLSDKENENAVLRVELEEEKRQKKGYQQSLYNANKRIKNWHNKAMEQQKEVKKRDRMLELKEIEMRKLREQKTGVEERNAVLREEKRRLQKQADALKAKIRRIPTRIKNALEKTMRLFGEKEKKGKTVHLKEKGVVPNSIRNMLAELVALDNVPARRCVDAFKRIAGALGFEVEGDISTRTTNRVVKEAGIAAKIHVVESFKEAQGIGISSDGTSHKNNNYKTHYAGVIDKEGNQREFFLGISIAANHTSETQRDEWIDLVDSLYEIYQDSPFCSNEANSREFWTAVTGMHSDHAEDQKKLYRLLKDFKERCEREKRGEKQSMTLAAMEHGASSQTPSRP